MAIYKKGDIYYIDYYVKGWRKREKAGPYKHLAEQLLNKRKNQIAENRLLDIKKEYNITLKEMTEIFLNDYSIPNKRSLKRDSGLLKNLIDYFGDVKLIDITVHGVEKYKAYRINKVKNSTVNRELACLKTLFNKAIEWSYAEYNPVKKVKLYCEDENQRTRYLNKDEINRLLNECRNEYLRDIIEVALNTGMRKGEILNLKWEHIDFKSNIIIIKKTKSHKIRKIPINSKLENILQKRKKEKTNNISVFCYKNFKNIKSIHAGFKNALSRAGIEDFRFHDLRHQFASHLVKNNVKLLTIKELLGHSTINMTLKYAYLAPDEKRGCC